MKYFNNLYQGRLGVLGYWVSFLVLGVIITPFSKPISSLAQDVILIRVVLSVIVLIGLSSIFIRRLHDLNKSALWILGLFIPIADLFFAIYLGFFPGTKEANKYGAKNRLVKQVLPFQ